MKPGILRTLLFVLVAAVAIFAMQIIFLCNLVYSYWKGKVYQEQ